MELYEFTFVGCSVFSAGFIETDLSSWQKYFMLYVMFYVIVSCDLSSNGRTQ